MSDNDPLLRYSTGVFTDHDLCQCTGLKERSVRHLITVGAVGTILARPGPRQVRRYGATTFKRSAAIAALNQAGFSLDVAGRMSALLPMQPIIYGIHDPLTVLLDILKPIDPATGLPPRLETPLADWFDPDKPATADPKNDLLVEIYEGRFVGLVHSVLGEAIIYGELRDDGTRYVAWYPFRAQHHLVPRAAKELRRIVQPIAIRDYIAKWNSWELPDPIDPDFLKYEYEKHDEDDDPLCAEAEATACSPLFKTSVNLTLVIRKALRRYLGIDDALSNIGDGS
jgi:hypothetical protein